MIFSESFSHVLMLKRTADRAMFPEKWEGAGGQVHRGESLTKAIKRVALVETGLTVEPHAIAGTYWIPGKADPLFGQGVPGIRFVCRADLTEPVSITAQHSRFAILKPKQALALDLIPTLEIDLRACVAFTGMNRLPFLFR